MNDFEIIDKIKNDRYFKEKLLHALINDEEFMIILAKYIWNMPLAKIGINISGTLGEYFLQNEINSKRNS